MTIEDPAKMAERLARLEMEQAKHAAALAGHDLAIERLLSVAEKLSKEVLEKVTGRK